MVLNRPLSILRVANITDNRTGGMSRYIHFVSDELRAAGHRVDHVFADGLGGNRSRLARLATPARVVRAVQGRIRAGASYDVVEVHEPIAAGYALGRLVSSALPPLLVTVYALEARGRESALRYARKRRRPFGWRPQLSSLVVACQANLALRLADHVCVETTEDAQHLQTRIGVPGRRITIQQGGVGSQFLVGAAGPRNGLLFVGTWIERKGIRDLVPAVSTVLERRADLQVTIAGCGMPEGVVLADFPTHHRPRVRVVPQITDDAELAAIYRSHAVFVFPSTFEGLPLALLEAAASGLAIVTTGVCGMKDTIRDGQTGLVVPVGDPARLAVALDRVVGDPALAARLGGAARESVAGYTWKRSAEQFLAACRAATGGVRWGC